MKCSSRFCQEIICSIIGGWGELSVGGKLENNPNCSLAFILHICQVFIIILFAFWSLFPCVSEGVITQTIWVSLAVSSNRIEKVCSDGHICCPIPSCSKTTLLSLECTKKAAEKD